MASIKKEVETALKNTIIEGGTTEKNSEELQAIYLKGIIKKPFFKSKKFWATWVAGVVPILNKVFGINLDSNEIAIIIVPFIVYVISLSIKEKDA